MDRSRASDPRAVLIPGTLLLVALAWIGGHFSGAAAGSGTETVALLAHAVPVAVVGAALVRGFRAPDSGAWRGVLLAVALCVKAFTVFAIVWSVTHQTGFGPRTAFDWVPIGAANAGGGLVLLGFLRARRPARAAS